MLYAILEGHKVILVSNVLEWAMKYSESNRHIALNEISQDCTIKELQLQLGWEAADDSFVVSTVFMGINHNFFSGKPLWFETMVFPEINGNSFQNRYETWEEAETGHTFTISLVLDFLKAKK